MKKTIKFAISLFAVAVVISASVGVTYAYLIDKTETIGNTFESDAIVNISIEEEFEGEEISPENTSVAKQVRMKNDSKNGQLAVVDAYIRANIVLTWVDDQGNVMPVDASKFVKLNLNLKNSDNPDGSDVDGQWLQGDDGFYYFDSPVAPEAYTDYLLTSVEVTNTTMLPTKGHLEADVLADAIQIHGDAANDAWNTPTSDGKQIYVEE